VDQNWHAVRSVNAHTDALLRSLKPF